MSLLREFFKASRVLTFSRLEVKEQSHRTWKQWRKWRLTNGRLAGSGLWHWATLAPTAN